MKTIKEAISDAVEHLKEDFAEALADGKLSIDEVLRLAGCMAGSVVGAAHSVAQPGEATKDAIMAGIGEAFDKYIEPIDIPWIIGPIERRVDRGLREFVLSAVESYVDELIEGYNHAA